MSFVLDKKDELIFRIIEAVRNTELKKSIELPLKRAEADRVILRVGGLDPNTITDETLCLLSFAANHFCTEEPECEVCPINKFCSKYRTDRQANYFDEVKNGLTFVDLFSGVGGASLGFEQAGLLPVFALDHEKNAVSTYKFNRPYMSDSMVVNDTAENVLDKARIGSSITGLAAHPDVVFGGVPCQGFSSANRQRLIDDPRNRLYKYFVNAVSHLTPRVVVMENVVGIRKMATQIKEDFDEIGYAVDFRILDGVDFGIPQCRRRAIFIGIPKCGPSSDNAKLEYIFLSIQSKTKKRSPVLQDAVSDLRPLEPLRVSNNTAYESEATGYKIEPPTCVAQSEYVSGINDGIRYHVIFNHKSRYNNDRDIEIFNRLPPGENSLHEAIEDIMPYKGRNGIFKDKYFKLEADKPCKTITAHMKFDCNMYIHPTQPRGLTVREAARIQSFPDDYIITGTFQKLYEQVGNAVPPLLAKAVGESVKEYLYRQGENNG